MFRLAAIVVYDSGRDLTWRLSHPAMFPDPNFAQSNILGQRFTLMDGIVGLAFDENLGVVYFQPLATDRYVDCMHNRTIAHAMAIITQTVCFVRGTRCGLTAKKINHFFLDVTLKQLSPHLLIWF